MTIKKYVLTAVGPDQPGIVAKLSGFLTEKGFNLEDSRMATLGGEFALILLVSELATVSCSMCELVTQMESLTGMNMTARETTTTSGRIGIPFLVRGYAMDHPGIVHALAQEVASVGANIDEMETSTYPAPMSGIPLFDVRMKIALPVEVSIQELRRRLTEVADKRNMDISIEPLRIDSVGVG